MENNFKIERIELKYIVMSGIISLLWFFLVIPFIVPLISGLAPPIQFIILEGGVYVSFLVFFNALTKSPLKPSLAIFCLLMMVDIISPPYFVDFSGNILSGPIGTMAASDYAFAWTYLLIIPKGILIPIMTYIITPMLLASIAALLMAPKQFEKAIVGVFS